MNRRSAIVTGVVAAAGFVSGTASAQSKRGEQKSSESGGAKKEAEVTPGEDLMQEHGVLDRILLIYEEAARRIDSKTAFDRSVVKSAAQIVRTFVEDYHEKQEEQFLFTPMRAQDRLGPLIEVLLKQHQRGRDVTDAILRLTAGKDDAALATAIRSFVRMYRPHAAREDTVLFPAFREMVGAKAYSELGEKFEENEHKRFGPKGFEDTVAEVSKLEEAFGIGDLSKFTP